MALLQTTIDDDVKARADAVFARSGLTSAMALLDRGATPQFPHALAVVRTWLLDRAVARFAEPWGAAKSISPSDDARAQIFSCFSKE